MIVTQVAGEGSFATHKYGQEKGGGGWNGVRVRSP